MKSTPINMAEAIIDPFWDPQLSGFEHWQVEPGVKHGLRVSQNWCWVAFEWARNPMNGLALRMSREFNLSCEGYDHVIVSVMAPRGSIVSITATTDKGLLRFEAPPAPELKKELALPLNGALWLEALSLKIESHADGIQAGWFNWIGLQNAELLPRYLNGWQRFDESWDPYLKPISYEPRFEPTYGFLIGGEQLEQLRIDHAAYIHGHGGSRFVSGGEEARTFIPEEMVRAFGNLRTDTRYCRERDHGNWLWPQGSKASIAGLLLKDKDLLRLGARFAMAMAMCGRWDDGMICHFPGSNFEHRCFVQSLYVHETALILDLAGEMFTDVGREYILRRISEEGLGTINFNTWKHEYIFFNNQLAWFSPGRILGYAVAERSLQPSGGAAKRVGRYTELAYGDLVESLEANVLPDGGYVEGPSYFRCVGGFGGLALFYYAKARGVNLQDIIPPAFKRTADFAQAIVSTDDDTDVVPICDGGAYADQEMLAVLSIALPDSYWVNMFWKSIERGDILSDRRDASYFFEPLLAWQLKAEIPERRIELKPFVFLSDMGIMASHREIDGEVLKLFIMGNKAGAGHTHEDKGSFVLEFGGETFAMDPGTCDYSSPLSSILQHCERHNMLIPTGTLERPHPESPLMADVKPVGSGDEMFFQAVIDATPGWSGYYESWVRSWESPSPDRLRIKDEYQLTSGDGVVFYWNTQRKVEVQSHKIFLRGQKAVVILHLPDGTTAQVDELPLANGATQRRIAIGKKGTEGRLIIEVELCLSQSLSD